jgi:hypothetical protein
MAQEVSRVFVNADGAGLPQLIRTIAAAEQSHPQRPAARGRKHVPDTVADHDRPLDRRVEPSRRCQEQIRVRLGISHLVARHDGGFGWIDTERGKVDGGRFHPSAGRDRPLDVGLGQEIE